MKIAMVLLLLTASAAAATTPPTDAELVARVDALAAGALADGPAAGFSIEIVRHRRVVVRKGYGQANVELAAPARPTTVYRIGSLTKQITAAAIMKLVEQGRVHLDDDLARWVPELPLHGKRVTVEQLLTHTSGIKDYTELPAFDRQSALENTHEEVLGFLRDQPLDFAPGEHWKYDNTGYFLLGLIIERAARKPYARFVEDELLRPVGLVHTRYCDNAPILAERAAGYALYDEQLVNAAPLGMAAPFAGGGMCSTADDLANWAQALAGGRVVSATSYAKMTTAARPKDGHDTFYGFGLRLCPLYAHAAVHHTGHINGFAGFLATLPDDDVTIAVLGNTEGQAVDALADRIVRVALGVPLDTIADLPADAARYIGIYESPVFRVEVYVSRGRLVSRDVTKPHEVRRLLHQGGDLFVLGGGPSATRVQFHVVDGRAATFTFTAAGASIDGKRVR
jgi:D-alanyl-D-alanine carboxypeptidase